MFSSCSANKAAWKTKTLYVTPSSQMWENTASGLVSHYLFTQIFQVSSRVKLSFCSKLLQTHISVYRHRCCAHLQDSKSRLDRKCVYEVSWLFCAPQRYAAMRSFKLTFCRSAYVFNHIYLLIWWWDIDDVVQSAGPQEGAVQAVGSVCGRYNHHILVPYFLALRLSENKKSINHDTQLYTDPMWGNWISNLFPWVILLHSFCLKDLCPSPLQHLQANPIHLIQEHGQEARLDTVRCRTVGPWANQRVNLIKEQDTGGAGPCLAKQLHVGRQEQACDDQNRQGDRGSSQE